MSESFWFLKVCSKPVNEKSHRYADLRRSCLYAHSTTNKIHYWEWDCYHVAIGGGTTMQQWEIRVLGVLRR